MRNKVNELMIEALNELNTNQVKRIKELEEINKINMAVNDRYFKALRENNDLKIENEDLKNKLIHSIFTKS
jgi:hypothetical protein